MRQLDHPNIVKLKGLVTSRVSCSLYLVFEYMEHDLAGLAACPGVTFTDAQIKCYMLQVSTACGQTTGRAGRAAGHQQSRQKTALCLEGTGATAGVGLLQTGVPEKDLGPSYVHNECEPHSIDIGYI